MLALQSTLRSVVCTPTRRLRGAFPRSARVEMTQGVGLPGAARRSLAPCRMPGGGPAAARLLLARYRAVARGDGATGIEIRGRGVRLALAARWNAEDRRFARAMRRNCSPP